MGRLVMDRRICDLLNAHDQKGMVLLFEAYYKSLVSWANTFLNDLDLAEDVVQEFFIALWNQEIHRELKPDTLASFLRVLVRNRCYNRMVKRDVFNRFVGLERIECIFEEYDDSRDRMVAKVMAEIALLPPRSREILNCVFVEGMKYREVAERYGISVSTVKTLLGMSVRKLRERMGREGFADFLLFYCRYC
ncbi:sigma-70 family RNA polymerase sigma factor [Butyricimonas sp.]|uniref:RNA polymerase sigma factor n=1 Tax=Butyricimonas sp. TaxID=1969738 RepID=UPI0025BCC242|nr:sigma-70 family RNA polymerase sigma factor [Butyricimonas sp.]